MTRILAIASAFLLITITLILFQPTLGPKSHVQQVVESSPMSQPELIDNEVTTRNDYDPLANDAGPPGFQPQLATAPEITQTETVATLEGLVAEALAVGTDDNIVPVNQATSAYSVSGVAASNDGIREMTWNVLRDIDKATGRSATPGAPGSLLFTIVSRSIGETAMATDTSPSESAYLSALLNEAGASKRDATLFTQPTGAGKTYRVQRGDTLQSIAFKFYGATSYFLQVYEANRDTLASPNSVSVGQTLRLPSF